MSDPIITLTTDFGEDSPYVAAMKGVILSINPGARIIDLSHQIPPQDVRYAAFFLAEAIPFFPPQALHVVVVDPGVGTERALLYVEAGGHRLLVPDNGAIAWLTARCPIKSVRRLMEPCYWRANLSATFHGRDILAPVAAHLSRGLDAELLGPEVDSWVKLSLPAASAQSGGWRGEVLFVDHFGNLLTNLPAEKLPDRPFQVRIGDQTHTVQSVRTYEEASDGKLVALVSSGGWWEFAVVHGSAARRLGVQRGCPIEVVASAGQG